MSKHPEYTEEDLSGLTEEERAELLADDGTDHEDEDDQDEEVSTEEVEEAEEEADGEEAGQTDEDVDAPGRDDGSTDDDGFTPAPLIQSSANVEEINGQLAEIQDQRDELAEQFDDGDLTAKEYQSKLAELDTKRDDLQWQLRKDELANEAAKQQADNAWYAAVGDFLKEHPELNSNQIVLQAFDTCVREITGGAETANLSHRKQLSMAYDKWAESIGFKKQEAEAPKAKTTAPARREVPPTLAKVPAAEINSTDDGIYSALDNLADTDPLAYEKKLASMTDAERERYLAAD